jgi:hypothetical protein
MSQLTPLTCEQWLKVAEDTHTPLLARLPRTLGILQEPYVLKTTSPMSIVQPPSGISPSCTHECGREVSWTQPSQPTSAVVCDGGCGLVLPSIFDATYVSTYRFYSHLLSNTNQRSWLPPSHLS